MKYIPIAMAPLPGGGGGCAPGAGGQGGFGGMLIPMVLMLAIFYFLLIRPQQKKQKDQQKMLASMEKGDHVVIAGGLHGIVSNVKAATVVVKIADNVKVEVDRSGITRIDKKSGESAD